MNKGFVLLAVAIVGLSCLGVFAILVISLSHSATNHDQAMLQIVAILSPTLIALIGAFKSAETEKSVTTKVIDLKSSVDSNKAHLAQQVVKVADLSDKVEQLNGK